MGAKPQERVDVSELGRRLNRRRSALGLSLRDVEGQLGGGITASSLSRIERGATPDPRNVPLLANWLELPLDLISWPGQSQQEGVDLETPDVVEVHLRADKNLDPAAAEALSMMFRHLYEGLASGKLNVPIKERKTKG
jgi:transcriptional regulator with XRE-family HTH domain